MKKMWGKKFLVFAVGVCLLLTMVCQNVAFVAAESPVKTMIVDFVESPYQNSSKELDIPNLFDISDISVDTGKVSFSRDGDKITVSVSEGDVIRVGPHTRTVTLTVKDSFGLFEEKEQYDVKGYVGILDKVDSGYDEETGLYWAKYEGEATKENSNYYKYHVEFNYTENIPPEIYLSEPKYGYITNTSLNIEGYIKDENIGDTLGLYFTFDSYNQSMTGNSFKDSIISDGTDQNISGIIDISSFGLKDGNHSLYFWAVDKSGARSYPAKIAFTVDTVPPAQPVLEPDKTEPTNQSVVVSVYYPTDAVKREVKINDGDWQPIADVTQNGQIILDDNGIVEARGSDVAGNTSPVAKQVVDNIDRIPPTAPVIKTSALETVEAPITATIEPGVDTGSGVDRTEYCLKGATTKDWGKYDEGTVITITALGETEICARTIDNAGNISSEANTKVTIKQQTNNGGGSGGGGNTGGNGGGSGGKDGNTDDDDKDKEKEKEKEEDKEDDEDKEIVEPGTSIPSSKGNSVDLSIFISADKSQYEEGEIITFDIAYKNKSSVSADNVVVRAEIPENTTPEDMADGAKNEKNIEWKIGALSANSSGKIQYKLKVDQLDVAEVSSSATVSTTANGTLLNKDDDESKTIFLLYSNRFGDNDHNKYIAGYEDNTFRPLNNITRAEVATIMANVLGLKEGVTGSKAYVDLSKTHWAYNNIIAVTEKGLFTGYEDGSFHPDSYITRAEFATVLANYLKLKNVAHAELNFADIKNHWAENFIEEIYRVKLIEGYLENGARLFKPDNNITRSEAVTIINKMLFRGPLEGEKVPFTDVDEGYWAYGHILESSIDHYYTRNKDQSETIVNKKVGEQ